MEGMKQNIVFCGFSFTWSTECMVETDFGQLMISLPNETENPF